MASRAEAAVPNSVCLFIEHFDIEPNTGDAIIGGKVFVKTEKGEKLFGGQAFRVKHSKGRHQPFQPQQKVLVVFKNNQRTPDAILEIRTETKVFPQ